jgi:hypothetical protein
MDPQMGQIRFPSTPKNAVHITLYLINKHNLTHLQKVVPLHTNKACGVTRPDVELYSFLTLALDAVE